jgi:hypothetical protein
MSIPDHTPEDDGHSDELSAIQEYLLASLRADAADEDEWHAHQRRRLRRRAHLSAVSRLLEGTEEGCGAKLRRQNAGCEPTSVSCMPMRYVAGLQRAENSFPLHLGRRRVKR